MLMEHSGKITDVKTMISCKHVSKTFENNGKKNEVLKDISLEVAENGEITGFKMRIENSKYTTVKALQSIGYETIASGDSYNDLGMIQASKAGFLFKSTEQIKKDHPELPAFEEYDELLAAIKKAL